MVIKKVKASAPGQSQPSQRKQQNKLKKYHAIVEETDNEVEEEEKPPPTLVETFTEYHGQQLRETYGSGQYNKYQCLWVTEEKLKKLSQLVKKNRCYVNSLRNIIQLEDPYHIIPQQYRAGIAGCSRITQHTWGKFHVS